MGAKPSRRTVRIFLASPSADTLDARATVVAVVQEINADPHYGAHVELDLRRWDDPARPPICDRKHNPQQDIVTQIGSPADCELVIGIFAHTMGGTLPVDRFPPPPGRDTPWHCSEWEVEQGLNANRAVWVFHDHSPLTETTAQAKRHSLAVSEYIERFNPPGAPMREGYNPFCSNDELATKLRSGLHTWLTSDYIATQVAGDRAPGRVVGDAAPADLRPYLTRRSAFWRSGAAGSLDRRFVNLTLMIDHGLEHQGPRHSEAGRFDLLSELLDARADVGAWVLVGAPGSGKSTVLQHHEMSTAAAALARIDAGTAPSDPAARPEICVWHRLSEYSADSPPPQDWLTHPTRWPQDLPPLAELQRVARVRFLLDGLNEIKAPDRPAQLAAVDRWTDWAASHTRRGDQPAPVFSVRTLDQSPMSAGDFEVRQIVLAPWSTEQIEAYCAGTLGEGNALWPTIQKDAALLKLSELPFNLWAQCELFRTLGRAARDRAELMGGLFWQMLARRIGDAPLKAPGLLGDDDKQHLANGQWKHTLRALPERDGCLVPWLDEALQQLHRRGRQVSVTRDELLAGLTPRADTATPAQWLYAARSLELIGEGGRSEFSTEPLLRCTHQLWQEFFAARGIRHWAAAAPDRLPDLRPPALTALADLKLGVQEPLPSPDPSHWEEPVKLAVQLVPDPLPWLQALQPVNLALAGRAALRCLPRLQGTAVLDDLRAALLARSRDAAVDVRLRIEAGHILGELGDPRYEERLGPEGQRYLWPRQWVAIPGGVYRIGNDTADDEGPVTEVELAPYAMAFAPVTNAEYRRFVEDAKGYEDEQWWDGEMAKRWLKEGVRNEAEIDYWRKAYAALRDDPDQWISDWPSLTEANREWYLEMAVRTEAATERLLEQWYGAKKYDRPQEWANPLFNGPNQPVVGICQFEALAYAKWLSHQSGRDVRLPSEAQWEAAARGAERRRWPWDGPDPEPGTMNADPAHLRRTSPVGVFPQADSPDGLTDLGGNVWEWTTSAYTDRHAAQALTEPAPEGLARRVVRGGAWSFPAGLCRAAYRGGYSPGGRSLGLGLRLVVSGPIPGTEP